MASPIPISANLHYVGTSRVADHLTLAPGINVLDGRPFDPEKVDPAALERGSYVPHRDDPTRGSMLAEDGTHVAVPSLVGRLLSASEATARTGTAVAGGASAVAAAMAVAGGTPAPVLAMVGAGIALRLAARAAARLGRPRIEAELAAVRTSVSRLGDELAGIRALNDAEEARLSEAVTILREPGMAAGDRIEAAKARLGIDTGTGPAPR